MEDVHFSKAKRYTTPQFGFHFQTFFPNQNLGRNIGLVEERIKRCFESLSIGEKVIFQEGPTMMDF